MISAADRDAFSIRIMAGTPNSVRLLPSRAAISAQVGTFINPLLVREAV